MARLYYTYLRLFLLKARLIDVPPYLRRIYIYIYIYVYIQQALVVGTASKFFWQKKLTCGSAYMYMYIYICIAGAGGGSGPGRPLRRRRCCLHGPAFISTIN